MVTTSLALWVGDAMQSNEPAYAQVARTLLAALPWAPEMCAQIAQLYGQAFLLLTNAQGTLRQLLGLACSGSVNLMMASLLGGGMLALMGLQWLGAKEHLAWIRLAAEHSHPGARLVAVAVVGVLQFVLLKLTEFFATAGSSAFIRMFTLPLCEGWPDRLTWFLSMLVLWPVGLLAATRLLGALLGCSGKHQHQKEWHLIRFVRPPIVPALFTVFGYWRSGDTFSNISLISVSSVVDDWLPSDPEQQHYDYMRRRFARHYVQVSADFFSVGLMIFPLGAVVGKFGQCANRGSILHDEEVELPLNTPGDHVEKFLALLRFALLVAIPLSPLRHAVILFLAGLGAIAIECSCHALSGIYRTCRSMCLRMRYRASPKPTAWAWRESTDGAAQSD
jgi:hypothetical protein